MPSGAMQLASPLGPVWVGMVDDAICWMTLADLPTLAREMAQSFAGSVSVSPEPSWLAEFWQRGWQTGQWDPTHWRLPPASPFALRVWQATRTIPRGQVRSYGWVAAAIGNPKAVRAVGRALADNPLPGIVPCHRVVPLTGFPGLYNRQDNGIKRQILEQEGIDPILLDALTQAWFWVADAETATLCFPTCPQPRQPQRLQIALTEAWRQGWHPCPQCRPPRPNPGSTTSG